MAPLNACNLAPKIGNFSRFPLFQLLKKRPPIIEKSVWRSFENKKYEVTVFYLFPCRSSWWTCFLPWHPSNGSNLSSKIVNIGFFGKRGNLSNCFAQIRGEKTKKSKFRRMQFGEWAERIFLHLKLIFMAAPKAVYFCNQFQSENDRSDHFIALLILFDIETFPKCLLFY